VEFISRRKQLILERRYIETKSSIGIVRKTVNILIEKEFSKAEIISKKRYDGLFCSKYIVKT
jgi:hypothetical protein